MKKKKIAFIGKFQPKKRKVIIKEKKVKISELRKGEIKKCENILVNNLLSSFQRNALNEYLKSIKNDIRK